MIRAIREMWWLLTGRGASVVQDDPQVSWFREQAKAAEKSVSDIDRQIHAERQRRQNIIEQTYLRGRRP